MLEGVTHYDKDEHDTMQSYKITLDKSFAGDVNLFLNRIIIDRHGSILTKLRSVTP